MLVERTPPPAPAGGVSPPPAPLADLELHLLLEAVYRVSGFDFRDYAPATLKRRVAERVRAENVSTISGLLERVLHHPDVLARFVDSLTRNAGSPFREPAFFRQFRDLVLPRLRTYSHVRIWVAGCGDDAYGLAILLREANLHNRTRIYATDASDAAVARARDGRFPLEQVDEYAQRYQEAGGQRRFSDYIETEGTQAVYRDVLRENMVHAQHNLATDGSFNEFQMIVTRGVLPHYNRGLAYRAHQVIYESLVRFGYLGLSGKESLRYTPHQRAYEEIPDTDIFYRRVR